MLFIPKTQRGNTKILHAIKKDKQIKTKKLTNKKKKEIKNRKGTFHDR